jgi:hypothetical protein
MAAIINDLKMSLDFGDCSNEMNWKAGAKTRGQEPDAERQLGRAKANSGCAWILIAIGLGLITIIALPPNDPGPEGPSAFKTIMILIVPFYCPVFLAAVIMLLYNRVQIRRIRKHMKEDRP